MEQKMEDNSSNPNIEWKKPGFGSSEKLSLKVNTKEAVLYDAKKKNGLQKSNPLTPADLPAGLKKIRKKIKDVFDEDEEDENDSVFVPSQSLQEANSLFNALNEDEKRIFKQQQTLHQIKMQNDAGKLEALAMANKTAQEAGLKGLQKETVNRNMLTPTLDAQGMENIIKQDLAKGLKIKNGQFTEGRYIQVLRGINNIRKVSGIKAVEGLNLQQVAQAADEKKVAKILLEKTGRKDPKQQKAIKKKAAKQKVLNGKSAAPKRNLSLHLLGEKHPQQRS